VAVPVGILVLEAKAQVTGKTAQMAQVAAAVAVALVTLVRADMGVTAAAQTYLGKGQTEARLVLMVVMAVPGLTFPTLAGSAVVRGLRQGQTRWGFK